MNGPPCRRCGYRRFRQAQASKPIRPAAAKVRVDGSGTVIAKRNPWFDPPIVPSPVMYSTLFVVLLTAIAQLRLVQPACATIGRLFKSVITPPLYRKACGVEVPLVSLHPTTSPALLMPRAALRSGAEERQRIHRPAAVQVRLATARLSGNLVAVVDAVGIAAADIDIRARHSRSTDAVVPKPGLVGRRRDRTADADVNVSHCHPAGLCRVRAGA